MKRSLGSLALSTLSCFALACGDDAGTTDGAGTSTTEQSTGQTSTPEPSTGGSSSSSGPESSSGSSSGLDSSGGSTAADSTTGEPGDVDVTLQFAMRVGEVPAACGTSYEGIGTAGTTIELLDLRLFVSNVRLVAGDGREVPLAMTDDGEWQLEGSALLDFEDGSGGCNENTTAETNTSVRGTAPAGDYTGVRFDLGLPFEQNHLNADEAPPPLNTTAMFWSWASGYKFAKIDLQNDLPAPANRWNFHLGSQGCDNGMAGPTIPPTEPCSRPGRPAIEVTGFDPLTGTIVLDVAALFGGADVTADTPMSAPGCMSFMPDVNECTPVFASLGLDWDTGDCADGCASQVVFHGE